MLPLFLFALFATLFAFFLLFALCSRSNTLFRNRSSETIAAAATRHHRVYHELGEVVEAQGDYADAARQYELACQTIKNGLEQGVLAEFQQGKDALKATLPASRAGMLNSWGLALKRCGFLLLHVETTLCTTLMIDQHHTSKGVRITFGDSVLIDHIFFLFSYFSRFGHRW